MIYLVGGAPRVGKTQFVSAVVKLRPMHAISTDAIRYMLRRSVTKDVLAPEFFINSDRALATGNVEQVLADQNAESAALWPYLEQLARSYDEEGVDLLMEGVAVTPQLIQGLRVPHKVIILCNQSASHAETVVRHAAEYVHDWLHAYDAEQAANYTRFFQHMNDWLQAEAQRYGTPYVELHDESFIEDIIATAKEFIG